MALPLPVGGMTTITVSTVRRVNEIDPQPVTGELVISRFPPLVVSMVEVESHCLAIDQRNAGQLILNPSTKLEGDFLWVNWFHVALFIGVVCRVAGIG